MSNIISHNTSEMREFANDIKKKSEEYRMNIDVLNNLIDGFIGTDFTGGLSEEFLESFEEKRKYFSNLTEVLEDCSNVMNERATGIDNDEDELSNSINRDNYFE